MSATYPKLARRARLRWDERDQKYMLVYPERGLVLNASAAEIVKLCDGTRSVDDIVAALVAASGAPSERVSGDVRALLQSLEDRRLVEWS